MRKKARSRWLPLLLQQSARYAEGSGDWGLAFDGLQALLGFHYGLREAMNSLFAEGGSMCLVTSLRNAMETRHSFCSFDAVNRYKLSVTPPFSFRGATLLRSS